MENLAWMRAELEGEFDMKTTVAGHSNGVGVLSEGKALNRCFKATSAGWEYECDPLLVEMD